MDNEKLEALRRKYADAKGGDIFDPELAVAARRIFSNAERRKWPFSDPATFLSAPFRPEAATQPDFGGLDVALIGVPMDATTNTAQIGAQALFELLCLVAIAHKQRAPSERR